MRIKKQVDSMAETQFIVERIRGRKSHINDRIEKSDRYVVFLGRQYTFSYI